MKLRVTTPLAVVLDATGVRHVRAEDSTGGFGLLPGHADFITVLTISVLTWRAAMQREHHIAVRGGVLSVRDGMLVQVATREAVAADDFAELERAVLRRFREEAHAEETARGSAARLEAAAIRRIYEYVRGERARPAPAVPGAPP